MNRITKYLFATAVLACMNLATTSVAQASEYSELQNNIKEFQKHIVSAPEEINLIGKQEDSFFNSLAKRATIVLRKEKMEQYNYYYLSAAQFRNRAVLEIAMANKYLNEKNLPMARKYMNTSMESMALREMYNMAAFIVWNENGKSAQEALRRIGKTATKMARFGIKMSTGEYISKSKSIGINKISKENVAGKFSQWITYYEDYLIDSNLGTEEEAIKTRNLGIMHAADVVEMAVPKRKLESEMLDRTVTEFILSRDNAVNNESPDREDMVAVVSALNTTGRIKGFYGDIIKGVTDAVIDAGDIIYDISDIDNIIDADVSISPDLQKLIDDKLKEKGYEKGKFDTADLGTLRDLTLEISEYAQQKKEFKKSEILSRNENIIRNEQAEIEKNMKDSGAAVLAPAITTLPVASGKPVSTPTPDLPIATTIDPTPTPSPVLTVSPSSEERPAPAFTFTPSPIATFPPVVTPVPYISPTPEPTIVPKPNMPDNFGAVALSFSEIQLNWQNNNSNETAIRIERKNGFYSTEPYQFIHEIKDKDQTTFIDSGLDQDTQYCYQVYAIDLDGQASERTMIYCAKTLQKIPEKPDLIIKSLIAPTNAVAGQNASLQNISITVTNQGAGSSGAFKLSFYWSTDPTIDQNDILAGQVLQFPQGLNTGETRNNSNIGINIPSSFSKGNYFVGAIIDYNNEADETDESNNSRTADSGPVIFSDPLIAPDLVAPADNSTLKFGLNMNYKWGAVSGAENYLLQIYKGANCSGERVGGDLRVSAMQTALNMPPAGVYSWHVIAEANNVKSVPSECWSFTVAPEEVLPNAPSNLTVRLGSDNQWQDQSKVVTLDWTDNSTDELSFIISEKEGLGSWIKDYMFAGPNIITSSVPVENGRSYCFKVRVRNTSMKESEYSNEACLAVP